MRLIVTLVAMFLGVMLSGCAGSAASIAMMSREDLKSVPDGELVTAYGNSRLSYGESKKIRSEIETRGLFSPEEWSRIESMSPKVGDSERLVFAALGSPRDATDTTTADGSARALYYERPGAGRAPSTVYIVNRKVVRMTTYR